MIKTMLFAFAIILCSGAQMPAHSQKLNKEENAIKAVIELESEYFWGRNYEKWKSLYVHEPYVTWTASSNQGVRRFEGWDAWDEEVKTLFKEDPKPQEYHGVVYKYNFHIRIYGNGAWVSFEQMNNGTKTWETRVMEKQKGVWKIAMVQLVYNANETMDTDTGRME